MATPSQVFRTCCALLYSIKSYFATEVLQCNQKVLQSAQHLYSIILKRHRHVHTWSAVCDVPNRSANNIQLISLGMQIKSVAMSFFFLQKPAIDMVFLKKSAQVVEERTGVSLELRSNHYVKLHVIKHHKHKQLETRTCYPLNKDTQFWFSL